LLVMQAYRSQDGWSSPLIPAHSRRLSRCSRNRASGTSAGRRRPARLPARAVVRDAQARARAGVPRVNRQQRYDDLTPQGRALLPWAEQALASLDGLTAEAARLRQGLTGTLRLGVIPTALSIVR
jgi:hypothetical protein